jgi:hypothetical protein
MYHIEVVVPDFFIALVVSSMTKLVGLNCQNRLANQFAVVNAPPMGAITSSGVERRVVDEPVKVLIDYVSNHYLLRMCIDD